MNRDRLIMALCYLGMALGIFLMGVQTGKWLNQPSVRVEGLRLEYVGAVPPTPTPAVGLTY